MNPTYTTPTDEMLLLAETLGEVKTKTEKLEADFATQARPLEAATNALSAALSGIKALQFHVLDNNLGALSARVEEMRQAINEQVGVIALELKNADAQNASKAGQEADALRAEIAGLQAQLGTLGAQFSAQLQRVEFEAREEAKKLQLVPGPAGAAGASLNPRGTFIDGETYNRLDVVSWLGSSYIAAVDGVTEKPSKNSNQWQVLASRGSGGSGGAGDFGSLAGVAQINQGGTGQTTRAAGLNALLPDQAGATQYMLLTDGAGTVSWGAQPVAGLPSQTSNSGRLLTTNGTSASWSNAVTVSGSNATVTGTLTANSTIKSTLSATGATGGILTAENSAAAASGNQASLFLPTSSAASTYWQLIARQNSSTLNDQTLRVVFGGVAQHTYFNASDLSVQSGITLKVLDTTASTSTSSGALVVGNGTSGGLGVGGAINAGTYVRAAGGAIISNGNVGSPGSIGTTAFCDVSGSVGRFGTYNFTTSAWANTTINEGGGNVTIGAATGVNSLTVAFTGASTNTSSGALVVSGGVGVAGAINAGDQIKSERTSGTDTASAVLGVLTTTGAGVTNSFGIDARVIVNNSSGTTTSATGLRALARVSNVSTVTQAVALLAQVDNPGAGTITTAYGLYVNPITSGGTNYAIYTGGGRINFQSLPTSSAGLAAGTIWNDSGTLKVA